MTNVKRNTILIIDDEPSNIVTLRHILSSDYTIFGVTDGISGITAAKLQKPDLILLDIVMPEMDGYEVLTRLKSTKETQDIPVIIITKLSSDESEEKGLLLGAEDYIQKPFSSLIVKLRIQNMFKVVTRNQVIAEQRQQQTILKQILHGFLTEPDENSLFSNTLRNVGELMELDSALLYWIDDGNSSLICRHEWIDTELGPETYIDDKLELNEALRKSISNMLLDTEGNRCLHSNNPYHMEVMNSYRKDSNDYIFAPVFFMGDINAAIVLSRERGEMPWNESEINFAILIAGIFSRIFERDAI